MSEEISIPRLKCQDCGTVFRATRGGKLLNPKQAINTNRPSDVISVCGGCYARASGADRQGRYTKDDFEHQ